MTHKKKENKLDDVELRVYSLRTETDDYICWLTEKTAASIRYDNGVNIKPVKNILGV